MNGIWHDKLSTAVATVRVHPNENEKDYDGIFTFLIHYINKRAQTLSVMVTFIGQTRPAMQQKTSTTHGTFKGKIELKK